MFDDGGPCNDFSIVSGWGFDADACIVHRAPLHFFDLAYAH